jgi:hypothetical protein
MFVGLIFEAQLASLEGMNSGAKAGRKAKTHFQARNTAVQGVLNTIVGQFGFEPGKIEAQQRISMYDKFDLCLLQRNRVRKLANSFGDILNQRGLRVAKQAHAQPSRVRHPVQQVCSSTPTVQ